MKKTMCLQVDNEFQQIKIEDLNNENNVKMRGMERHLLLKKSARA